MIPSGEIWLAAGVVLCLAEILHPGVFLLWCGIGAICTGLATEFVDLTFEVQLACFILFTGASLMVPLLRQKYRPTIEDKLNVPGGVLVGETCRAKEFKGREGRVEFRDGGWRARIVEGETPTEGSLLRIVGREGTVLLVCQESVRPE
jgi:membrane protein implicated in regulation of membrane protease activity